jgi:hypothetical protein
MRSQKIDFFRGLALLIIFIDHVYNNRLGGYTLRGYGIANAAEIFFFCSGFVSAIVYTKAIQRTNFYFAQLKATKRSLYIYFFHIISFLSLIIVTLPVTDLEGVRLVLKARGLYDLFYVDWSIGLNFFTLQYLPFLFSILPTYIVLSLITPFFALLLMRSSLLLFVLSITIYLIIQFFPALNLMHRLHISHWAFNPFAYQFLFVIGMLFGYNSITTHFKIPLRKDIVAVAILILLSIFIVHNFIPFLYKHYNLFPSYIFPRGLPFTGTINQEPLRIIHFLILVYVVLFLIDFLHSKLPHAFNRLKKIAAPIIICGQNSIYIFTLGLVLSYIGGYIIASFGNSAKVWIPVNIVGVSVMLWAGAIVSNRKHNRQARDAKR